VFRIEILVETTYSSGADKFVPGAVPVAGRNEWARAHFSFAIKIGYSHSFRVDSRMQSMALDLNKIRALADRIAASYGLDVVEIEYLGGSKQRVLRVFIEKNAAERATLAAAAEKAEMPEKLTAGELDIDQLAWVTHEDCKKFSDDFGAVLDVEELIPANEYTLEVSSPGLDRKLYGRGDYERFRGNVVKLQTFEPVAGNRHWQGRLTQVGADSITLDLSAMKQKGKRKKAAGVESAEIALTNIEKANLVPEI
jgi:ribosome maturation factor RimP